MHIVIGGEGEIAFRLAAELMAEHEVVLVLPDAETAVPTAALDVATTYGALSSSGVLRQAGVARAALFVACSKDDEDNLVSCVAAKRLGAKSTTCFLFRPDHRSRPGEDVGLAELMGIDHVVRPALQLANEMVRIASVPGALDAEMFEDGKVRLLRHQVELGSALTTGSLMDIELPKDVVFVMGRRGDRIFVPTGKTRFEAGDKVTVMGSRKGLARLLGKFLRSPDRDSDDRTATVVGGGTVGLAVARGLAEVGWNVKIIEPVRERCEEIAPLVKGLVLHGDGSDISLLEEEQVGGDSVLVVVTNNDEKNLLVSLLGKQLGVPRIVTRAVLPSNERLFEQVGIDVVRSAQGAAIQSVVCELVTSRRELLAELEHGDAEVLELTLPGDLKEVQLKDLRLPIFAIVGAIKRGKKVIIPRGDTELRPNDQIFLFCSREDEDRAKELFLETLRERSRAK